MTDPQPLPTEESVVRGELDRIAGKDWDRAGSVLAMFAAPHWDGPDRIDHRGRQYRVVPCVSVLAVRDALRERNAEVRPILLTPFSRSALGVGICEHLVDHRPLSPDPAVALRRLFTASRQESALYTRRDAARAALAQLSGRVVSPVPDGLLTRNVVMSTVAQYGFGLRSAAGDRPPSAADLLVWSADCVEGADLQGPAGVPTTGAALFAAWSDRTPLALEAEVVDWLRSGLGCAADPLTAALRTRPQELLPLGLVVGLLFPDGPDRNVVGTAAAETQLRTVLESYLGLHERLADDVLTVWAQAALTATDRLAARRTDLTPILSVADALAVGPLRARELVGRSDHLPSGLHARVHLFTLAATTAIGDGSEAAGSPELLPAALLPVEEAWLRVSEHVSNDARPENRTVAVVVAVLRLLRWLAGPAGGPGAAVTTRTVALRYLDHESWVDTAVNDAAAGSSEPDLAALVSRVLGRVRADRAAQDRSTATLLPGLTYGALDGPLMIEDVLDRVVAPLVRPAGGATVLLIVADGMSAAAAHDILGDLSRDSADAWQEAELASGGTELRAAVAVLPTVTHRSRCSLLSGRLADGRDTTERTNFTTWLRARGYPTNAQTLFHKADLDAQAAGFDLAAGPRRAVEDTIERPVVACVLNSIDDALDRSDPLRTEWNRSTVRHLGPLLAAAARVGRTVVLTSDHGHVVERREIGIDRRGDDRPARWRSTGGEPAGADEIEVSGARVLTDAGSAILAVDEQLRYSALKAGYHGGGAPAEFVVPVIVLVSGEIPAGGPLRAAPTRLPRWWQSAGVVASSDGADALTAESLEIGTPVVVPARTRVVPGTEPLFTVPEAAPVASAVRPRPAAADAGDPRLARLLRSRAFTDNVARFGGGTLTADHVYDLLDLLIRSGGAVAQERAAEALRVPDRRARRVVAAVSQIVNVDGIAVLTQRPGRVLLNVDELFAQFRVSG